MLHPDMPLLVWLMCAQAKGYTMGAAAASACLQLVHQLACMPVRDRYPVKPAELLTGRSVHNGPDYLKLPGWQSEPPQLSRCIPIGRSR